MCNGIRFFSTPQMIVALLLAGSTSVYGFPVSYSGSVPGPGGRSVAVDFSGDVTASGVVTGVLAARNTVVNVEGQITKSGLTGTFTWDGGAKAGGFSAAVEDDGNLRGGYSLDGAKGNWSMPTRRLPSAVRNLLAK